MICRMCVLESANLLSIFENIPTQADRATIIAQHFGFEPLKDDPITNMVCVSCWAQIESFHKYYLNVEEAQRKFSKLQLGKKIKEDVLDYDDLVDRKEILLITLEKEDADMLPDTSLMGSPEPPNSETPMGFDIQEAPNDFYKSEINTTQADKSDEECIEDDDSDSNDDDEDDTYEPPNSFTDLNNESDSFDSDDDKKLIELTKLGSRHSASIKNIQNDNETLQSDTKSFKSNSRSVTKKTLPKKRGRKRKSDKPVPTNPRTSEYRIKSKQYDEEIAKRTKLKCDLCEKEFTIFNVLQRHYRAEHKVKGYVVCCTTKFFKRGMFLDHIMKHLEPDRLRCDICKKNYCSRRALHDHILVYHAPGDVKTFQCDQCPRKYLKQYQLNIHKKKHIPKDASQYKCDECGKGFNTNNALQTHRRYIHENKYAHMCHICAKVLRSRTLYLKHKLVEHEGYVEPKQQCKECGAWLKNAFRLKLHMKKHKERESDFICTICGKSSPSSTALQSHVKYVHEAQRLHQCTFCNKAFKRAITLKEHLTTHTGDVLYTCPHCPKTFNSRANMHSHRKKKHPQEWEEARRIRGAPIGMIGKIRIEEETDPTLDDQNLERNVNSVTEDCEIGTTYDSIKSMA